MTAAPGTDFESFRLQAGLRLHVQHSQRYKSVSIDLFTPQLLRPVDNTRMALVGRLLERGTRRFPGLLALNRYADELYGAAFSSQTETLGAFQVLHLHFDAVHSAFLPGEPNLLAPGLELLSETLTDPYLVDGTWPHEWVAQEKEALRRGVDALNSDRTRLAQRHCLDAMCPGEPYRLDANGDPQDLAAIDGPDLLACLRQVTRTAPLDVYVSGEVAVGEVADLCRRYLGWTRGPVVEVPVPPRHVGNGAVHRLNEHLDVAQGRLLLGYRTDVTVGGPQRDRFPALALLNLLLGGDAHSRLYQIVREEAGLCYHIASYTEPMGGLLFVEAGVESADREAVYGLVDRQLQKLADHGPRPGELERSKALALQRLDGYDDERESLVRFDYYRRLARGDVSRTSLRAALAEVDGRDIAAEAAHLELDTDYFLQPDPPAAAGAA